jgi:hypothetical protein
MDFLMFVMQKDAGFYAENIARDYLNRLSDIHVHERKVDIKASTCRDIVIIVGLRLFI